MPVSHTVATKTGFLLHQDPDTRFVAAPVEQVVATSTAVLREAGYLIWRDQNRPNSVLGFRPVSTVLHKGSVEPLDIPPNAAAAITVDVARREDGSMVSVVVGVEAVSGKTPRNQQILRQLADVSSARHEELKAPLSIRTADEFFSRLELALASPAAKAD
jgi:hypothetical protein